MLEEALAYARRGWSIIPIQPGNKNPLVEWTEFRDKSPTEHDIRSWWKRWPNANIGLVTGSASGVVVADVDVKRGGNPRSQFDVGPTGLVADTGGGGYHLFYQYPYGQQIKNSVGKTTGIDVRAQGGIIVLPPSVHPSGRRYKWRTEGDMGPWQGTPPETTHIQDGHKEENKPNKWLSDVLSGVDAGTRDDTATKLAGYFEGKGLPRDVAIELMKSWNLKNRPPLDEPDLYRIANSVYAKAKSRGINSTSGPFTATPFTEFMRKWAARDEKWIVEDWFPDGTMMLTVAPPGSYKSWMILDLCVSVASGLPFLGHFPVLKQGPVIIIQQEDPGSDIQSRLASITMSKLGYEIPKDDGSFSIPVVPDLPIFIHEERQLHFEDQNVMASFASYVEQIKPALVMIDPLYSAASTDDYMAKAASSMMLLKSLRDRWGTSFAIAHHTNKKGKDSDEISLSREDAWGSQFLNAFLETGWQVRRMQVENTVVLRRHFKIRGDLPDLELSFDIASEGDDPHYAVTVRERTGEAGEGLSLAARVMEILENGEMNPRGIAKLANEPIGNIRKILNTFVQDGVLIKIGSGYEMAPTLPGMT